MEIIIFNTFQIVIMLLIIFGCTLISLSCWKTFSNKHKSIAIASVVVIVLMSIAVEIFFTIGVVWRERSVTSVVTEIEEKTLPVFMGPDITYSICISDDTPKVLGEISYSFSSNWYSSKKIKATLKELREGDCVVIKYNFWHEIYDIEILKT